MLVGPTASGKSALALAAARRWPDVEIVSMDSMQVYRGMDIGTAKASPADRSRVPHHMIDIADPSENYSVARFQRDARSAIRAVEARGHRALLVGGTGLYVHAVIDDFQFPGEDLAVRARIDAQYLGDDGVAEAYEVLWHTDPAAAARMEPNNRRRIVRALEVFEITGRQFSSFGPGVGAAHAPIFDVRMAGLTLDAVTLAARTEQRLAAMVDAGLVAEVEGLLTRSGGWSRTARQAIGYKEFVVYLEGRVASVEAATAQCAARTRQFGRRQRAWFRREDRITWFDADRKSETVADDVMQWWSS
ncbi:MAG: tRNA (adenosine(37)-N6)-dimethylallyltransferase MiaA [Acidimicrobiia bacterium]